MRVAIVGFQGSGKSTFFSALTGIDVQRGKKDNIGVLKVPDVRVTKLSQIFCPKKTTYAEIRFEDIGMLDPENISKLRAFDELIYIIDNFSNNDPLKNLKDLELELNISDLSLIEKRIIRLKKEDPRSREIGFLENLNLILEKGNRISSNEFNEEENKFLSVYRFFSHKKILVVVNNSEDKLEKNNLKEDFKKYIDEQNYEVVNLCATLENEISKLSLEEQKVFLKDYNLEESARDFVIRKSYDLLGLMSFFTVGQDEVRAWTIGENTKARKAAGKIHSDLERGFIRAEVISYETFLGFGDLAKAKLSGMLRVEGKDYIVQDGDILNIRFNV